MSEEPVKVKIDWDQLATDEVSECSYLEAGVILKMTGDRLTIIGMTPECAGRVARKVFAAEFEDQQRSPP